MKRDDAHDGDKCAYNLRLALIKALLAEYCYTIAALVFLCALFAYAVQMQKLFEFLVFAVVVLQLELAYRQWWLEAGGREAKFEFYDVDVGGGGTLRFWVMNVSRDFVHNVSVPFLIVPLSLYSRLSALFSLRPTLIKHFIKLLRSCAECEGGARYKAFFLPPGERYAFGADLLNCIKSYPHHAVVFAGLCRETLSKPFSQCDVYVTVFLDKLLLDKRIEYVRYDVERGPPGVLTRIPNMISDFILMLRISVAEH